jgi:hypothetical protein
LSETEKCLQMLLRDLRRLETNLLSEGWYEKNAEDEKSSALFAAIKSALDNVRTSLWCRIQASSARNPESTMNLVEHHRLQRAVELLRATTAKSLRIPEARQTDKQWRQQQ